jgi:hypothetical protein
MVSWQSIDDLRVMEDEAENSMVIKPSGYNEFRAYRSNRSALVRFAAEAGESIKRIDHLVDYFREGQREQHPLSGNGDFSLLCHDGVRQPL